MLAGREHSAHELSRKLIAKGHSQRSVEAVLTKLQELDLQSDQRFAEMYVRSRVNKGYGPIKIRQDLYQRGLDDELIDAELTFPAERWVDLARSIRGKRFSEAQPDGRDAWNTQARFLARRGFPADLIYRVLGQL
jgi:regulatory protein